MIKPGVVTEGQFISLMRSRLGRLQFPLALKIFRNFGDRLSWDVTDLLLHAVERNKVQEVLNILEYHFETHLRFQRPEARGFDKETEAMFRVLWLEKLNLQLRK